MKQISPNCPLDNSPMRKGKESKTMGMALIVFVIGLLFTMTGIGALIGIPIILWSLHIAMKRRGLWICTKCGHQIERKIAWNELG